MALVATSETPVVEAATPFIISTTEVTLTGDGTATTSAVTGIPHGGPSGREPFEVSLVLTADSAAGGEIVQEVFTATDTDNDELDMLFTTAAAVANGETVVGKLVAKFLEAAPDVGRDAPVGYTAPSNANF